MIEGIKSYRAMSIELREQRLLRSGLEVALTSASKLKLLGISGLYNRRWALDEYENIEQERVTPTYKEGLTQRSHRQRYRISVYNLTVLEILPLGAGPGMIAASRYPVNRRTAGMLRSSGSLQNEGDSTLALAPPLEQRGVTKLLTELAVRALYSLGLDSGEVLLMAMGSRRYVVEEISPLLEQPGTPLPEPYRSAAQILARNLALEQSGRPGLLMGMDPEFLLLRENSNRVVPASRFLPMAGVAGCDAGPPGTRGAFPVAELRPEPRGEPRALLAQLMSAVAAADRLITDRSLRWRAGGMPLRGWALGGHLHFSGVTLRAPLLRALDNYLALPMLLLEDARAGARRPRYGVLGDFRYQSHGGFEYRTLPSFLVSPVVAKGAVHLAHLIVSHYEDLPLRPLDREELHAAYYSGDKPPLRAAFTPLLAQLRSLSGYEQAARYIEPMFHYIAAERTWDESRDIRELWIQREPQIGSLTRK